MCKIDAVELSARLATARMAAMLSQRELAALSGVGLKTISSFESGSRTDAMKVSQLDIVARSCGTSAAALLSCRCTQRSQPPIDWVIANKMAEDFRASQRSFDVLYANNEIVIVRRRQT